MAMRKSVRYRLDGKADVADDSEQADAIQERYSFADIIGREYLEEIVRFQRIFGRYIPELLEDEHATIYLHQRLRDSFFTNPPETINRSTFDADMKRFRRAVTDLANSPLWGTKPMMTTITRSEDEGLNRVTMGVRDVYDFLLTLQDMAHYDHILPAVLDELESHARKAAYYVPDRRNINWEAVHAVDHLRGFWESWTETSAPRRALNPESPFANYLRDAFEFFGIQGDPVSAFKRWVALEDEEPYTWK